MDDEAFYLYAFTWSDCPADGLGPGVDPRFRVGLVSCGRPGDGPDFCGRTPQNSGPSPLVRVAALASRVGLDQFDLSRLAGQSAADVEWLSQVAFRHNQIITQAARHRPVLPLRIGSLFRSRASLSARLEQCRPVVTEFLERLGDRQEWAAKIYLDQGHLSGSVGPGSGKDYLVRKRQHEQARRTAQEQGQREAAAVEAALASQADLACRVRILPAGLTGRREKMLLNAAYLVSRSASEAWLRLAERLGRAAAEKGLLLEITGPWPPYHFCPEVKS
jgi:hypothetical protein